MEPLPRAVDLDEEGSEGSSQREMLTRGPPARANRKGFIVPSLKSQKPCCCFLRE